MKAWQAVSYRLANFAGVYNLIGGQGLGTARVYPVRMPDDPPLLDDGASGSFFPCIIFRQKKSDRVKGVYVDPGHVHVGIELSCYARTYSDAKSLAEQVRLALERYGTWPSGLAVNGVTLFDVLLEDDADDFDAPLLAYKVVMDLTVIHAE